MNSAVLKFGNALRTGEYLPKLKQMRHEAARLEVTGVPTFFIEDRERIVGAQSIEVFRPVLRSG
jgi:predicted DsbA family dithiol-disulfide isomerase